MLVEPIPHESIGWAYGDLAEFIRRERRPKKLLQYQHVRVKLERSIGAAYPRPGNAVDVVAKHRQAFRLLGLS